MSIDEFSRNLNGFFGFKEITVCQRWSIFDIANCNHWWHLSDLLP